MIRFFLKTCAALLLITTLGLITGCGGGGGGSSGSAASGAATGVSGSGN